MEEEILESQKEFNENKKAIEKSQELLNKIEKIAEVLGGKNDGQ